LAIGRRRRLGVSVWRRRAAAVRRRLLLLLLLLLRSLRRDVDHRRPSRAALAAAHALGPEGCCVVVPGACLAGEEVDLCLEQRTTFVSLSLSLSLAPARLR
jgi:hypothetical protein